MVELKIYIKRVFIFFNLEIDAICAIFISWKTHYPEIRTSKFSPEKISRKCCYLNCSVEELFKTGKFIDVARNS